MPVIDPLRRFHHAKRPQATGGKYPDQIDRMIPLHTKFWATEEAMEEGNPVGILDRDEDLERFVASYRKRGGEVDLALYEVKARASSAIPPPRPLRSPHAAHHRFRTRASWLRR